MNPVLAAGLYVLAVVVVLLVIGLGLKVVADRYSHVAGGAGDRVVRGRAAHHVRLLSRTLVVRGEAVSVAAVVSPTIDPYRFVPVEPRGREVAAWVTKLPPAAGRTRLVVRPSATPGWTEFGVVEYAWWSRFPQGGRPVRRATAAVADLLAADGWQVVERQRVFEGDLPAVTSDGPRRALELDPPGPGIASMTPNTRQTYEQRACRGEALAPLAGSPDADAELLSLLLDPEDTLVTRRTADALLARRDLTGLRLVLLADVRAEADTSTWLWSAVSHRRAAALGAEDVPLRQQLWHLAMRDFDPDVREVARRVATYVFGPT